LRRASPIYRSSTLRALFHYGSVAQPPIGSASTAAAKPRYRCRFRQGGDVFHRCWACKGENGVSLVVQVEDDADHYEGCDPGPGLSKTALDPHVLVAIRDRVDLVLMCARARAQGKRLGRPRASVPTARSSGGQPVFCDCRGPNARRVSIDADALALCGSEIVGDRRPVFALVDASGRRPVGAIAKLINHDTILLLRSGDPPTFRSRHRTFSECRALG